MIEDEIQKFRDLIEKTCKDSWSKPAVSEKNSIICIKWWHGKRTMIVFIEKGEYDVLGCDENMRVFISGYFKNIEGFEVFWKKLIEKD